MGTTTSVEGRCFDQLLFIWLAFDRRSNLDVRNNSHMSLTSNSGSAEEAFLKRKSALGEDRTFGQFYIWIVSHHGLSSI